MRESLVVSAPLRRALRSSALFFAVALVPAIAQLACFAWALVARVRYPMDLEWLEGPQLYEAFRFAHGLPVYGPPSQGFVPCPYPPLFHAVVGLVGRCFGFDWWNGRVVSDAAIVAVLAVQAAVVVRAAPSRRVGMVLAVMGAACVAAAYRPLEASMDLARVDMLGVAIVAVAAWMAGASAGAGKGTVATVRPGVRAVALGALLCAAVYTKQTNLFYVAFILAWLARRDRRAAALAGGVALGVAVVALVALQQASGGWFWTWMVTMRHHALVPAKCAVAGVLVTASAAALGAVLRAFRRRGWLTATTRFWSGILAASVPACVGPMLTGGGWINNLIGLVTLAVVVALLIACDALRGLRASGGHVEHPPDPSSGRLTAATAERWLVATMAAFLAGALYDPSTHVPDAARTRDAQALHATVRALDGDVLLPMYPFVAARDGKTSPQISLVAYADTVGPGRLNADAERAVADERPDWVILFGHDQEEAIARDLRGAYTREPTDLRVQALEETTGRSVTIWHRAHKLD